MSELNGGDENDNNDDHVSEFSAARKADYEMRNLKPNLSMAKNAGRKADKIGGGSVNARLVNEIARRIGRPIKCVGKEWFGYEKGIWKLIERGRERFEPIALEVQDKVNVNARRTDDLLKYFEQSHRLRDGQQFYGAIQYVPGDDMYAINCANCVLNLSVATGELIATNDHSSEYMFTKSLGHFDANASCARFRTVVLPEILPELADRKLVWDYACYCLLPHSRFQQAMFFIGVGENGKSLVAETMANAIGRDVKSNITFHQLCSRDQKHMCRLEGMLTNVSTETDNKIIDDVSAFNALVCGESLSISELYKGGRSMVSNAKPWFLMNHIPQFKTGSYAIARRMLIVHFGRNFQNSRNSRLSEELESEGPGILAYLIRRMPKIAAMHRLGEGSEISQRLYKGFANNVDIIHSFVTSCLRGYAQLNGTEYFIGYDVMFNIFREYAQSNGHDYPWTSRQFFKHLKNARPDFSSNNNRRARLYSTGNIVKTIGPTALSELGELYLRKLWLSITPHTLWKLDLILRDYRDIV